MQASACAAIGPTWRRPEHLRSVAARRQTHWEIRSWEQSQLGATPASLRRLPGGDGQCDL